MTVNHEFPLFGLYTSQGSFQEIVASIVSSTKRGARILVVTPNVDHFLRWKSDFLFREVYAKSDFRLLDGQPLVWLSKLLGNRTSERITGIDLSVALIGYAEKEGIPINFIGGSFESLVLARKNLTLSYPHLIFQVFESPTPRQLYDDEYFKQLAQSLNVTKEKFIFLCLGSPKQEYFFQEIEKSVDAGAFLCVGGTVDFLAGINSRAPRIFQKVGLEWFYRFLQEPQRLFHRYFVRDSRILIYLIVAFSERMFRVIKGCFIR